MASDVDDEGELPGLLDALRIGLAGEERLLGQLRDVLDVLRATQGARDRHGLSSEDIWNAVTARLEEQEIRPAQPEEGPAAV